MTMLDLTRRHDWRPRLFDFTSSLKARVIVWGESDCAVGLAAGAIKAMTDTDPAEAFRGRYRDAASARALLDTLGQNSLADLVRTMLPETHISAARVGDIALLAEENVFGGALGVVIGPRILVLRETGTGTVPLLDAATAFRVG